jgi:RHS repeat-associated protein
VALTDGGGNVVERFQYAPFGGLANRNGVQTVQTPFLYNGRDGVVTDGNGLYYMRARYYEPRIGRFLSNDIFLGDILKAQSSNRYAYVQGNPISSIDPIGFFSFGDAVEFGAESLIAGSAATAAFSSKFLVENALGTGDLIFRTDTSRWWNQNVTKETERTALTWTAKAFDDDTFDQTSSNYDLVQAEQTISNMDLFNEGGNIAISVLQVGQSINTIGKSGFLQAIKTHKFNTWKRFAATGHYSSVSLLQSLNYAQNSTNPFRKVLWYFHATVSVSTALEPAKLINDVYKFGGDIKEEFSNQGGRK